MTTSTNAAALGLSELEYQDAMNLEKLYTLINRVSAKCSKCSNRPAFVDCTASQFLCSVHSTGRSGCKRIGEDRFTTNDVERLEHAYLYQPLNFSEPRRGYEEGDAQLIRLPSPLGHPKKSGRRDRFDSLRCEKRRSPAIRRSTGGTRRNRHHRRFSDSEGEDQNYRGRNDPGGDESDFSSDYHGATPRRRRCRESGGSKRRGRRRQYHDGNDSGIDQVPSRSVQVPAFAVDFEKPAATLGAPSTSTTNAAWDVTSAPPGMAGLLQMQRQQPPDPVAPSSNWPPGGMQRVSAPEPMRADWAQLQSGSSQPCVNGAARQLQLHSAASLQTAARDGRGGETAQLPYGSYSGYLHGNNCWSTAAAVLKDVRGADTNNPFQDALVLSSGWPTSFQNQVPAAQPALHVVPRISVPLAQDGSFTSRHATMDATAWPRSARIERPRERIRWGDADAVTRTQFATSPACQVPSNSIPASPMVRFGSASSSSGGVAVSPHQLQRHQQQVLGQEYLQQHQLQQQRLLLQQQRQERQLVMQQQRLRQPVAPVRPRDNERPYWGAFRPLDREQVAGYPSGPICQAPLYPLQQQQNHTANLRLGEPLQGRFVSSAFARNRAAPSSSIFPPFQSATSSAVSTSTPWSGDACGQNGPLPFFGTTCSASPVFEQSLLPTSSRSVGAHERGVARRSPHYFQSIPGVPETIREWWEW